MSDIVRELQIKVVTLEQIRDVQEKLVRDLLGTVESVAARRDVALAACRHALRSCLKCEPVCGGCAPLIEALALTPSDAANLVAERAKVIEILCRQRTCGTCECARCFEAVQAASGWSCRCCGFSGQPVAMECCCYDTSCPGGDRAGAGCPHGGLVCPVCDDGEADAWEIVKEVRGGLGAAAGVMTLKDKKGGDPEEWPERLRVREVPMLGDYKETSNG